MLASNRIPGTRIDLKRFTGASDNAHDNTQIMDRFLEVIVAGDVTAKTKAALVQHVNDVTPLTISPPARPANNEAMADDSMDGPAPFRQRQQRQLARADANITDPVTKVVGLILGSPEFQRQ